MKTIHTDAVKEQVRKTLLEMNCTLSADVEENISWAIKEEKSPVGIEVLQTIEKNLQIAGEKNLPICQDTGMVVAFVKIGQQLKLDGPFIGRQIEEGVRQAYEEGYFRKSVVSDPLLRKNTKDNTPAVIHYEMVEGEQVEIILTAKGFGSENMSGLKMLKPADGVEGVIEFVLETVEKAGPNACPPLFIGIGIGGTMEKAAILAKKALVREEKENGQAYYRKLESELLEKLNRLGIGPMGLGGTQSVLQVGIETYPTHIAGLPVAVNVCCHVNRHAAFIIESGVEGEVDQDA